MRLAKIVVDDMEQRIALLENDRLHVLDMEDVGQYQTLKDILHSPEPIPLARYLIDQDEPTYSIDDVEFLTPIDRQEVWAAGVTYKRSQVARMEESKAGASHYDKVYTADRPEIFFKATPNRVAGPGKPVRVRSDSKWSVPEPELALYVSPDLKLCGYTIGNDMSARDIEGENPLYLPQAKLYRQCCALGPCVYVPEEPLSRSGTRISLLIERDEKTVFQGETHLGEMARDLEDLIAWLGKENEFPNGAILLTGTGIVPPDDFTLEDGDLVSIEITGIGTLTNPVVKD